MDDPQQTPSTSSVNVPKPADEYVTIQEKVAILTQLASIEAQNAQIMRHLQRPPTPPPIQMASAQVPPYMAELIVQVVTGLQQRGQPHPQHAQVCCTAFILFKLLLTCLSLFPAASGRLVNGILYSSDANTVP